MYKLVKGTNPKWKEAAPETQRREKVSRTFTGDSMWAGSITFVQVDVVQGREGQLQSQKNPADVYLLRDFGQPPHLTVGNRS